MKVHGKVGPTIARVSCINIEIQSLSLEGNRMNKRTKPIMRKAIIIIQVKCAWTFLQSHRFQSTNQRTTCKTLRERPRGRTKKVRYFINGWVKASKCSLAHQVEMSKNSAIIVVNKRKRVKAAPHNRVKSIMLTVRRLPLRKYNNYRYLRCKNKIIFPIWSE